MIRFTIRDVLWLTVVVAIGLGWGLTRHHDMGMYRELAGRYQEALQGWNKSLDRVKVLEQQIEHR